MISSINKGDQFSIETWIYSNEYPKTITLGLKGTGDRGQGSVLVCDARHGVSTGSGSDWVDSRW